MKLTVLSVAQGVSTLGSAMTVLAITLLLQEQRADAALISFAVLAGLLPSVILGPLAAPVLDRLEIRNVLVVSLAARSVIGFGLAVAPDVSVLLLLLGAGSAISVLDGPALQLLGPEALAPGQSAMTAFARMDLARSVGSLLGPASAGVLYSALGARSTLLLDAATYAAMGIVVATLGVRRFPPARARLRGQSWLAQIAAGPDTYRRDPVLLASLLGLSAAILFTSLLTVAEVFYVRESLHADALLYGIVLTSFAGGRILASGFVAPRLASRRQSRILIVGGVIMGVSLLVMGIVPTPLIAVIGFTAAGAANSLQALAIKSLVRERVKAADAGRAFATLMAVNNGATMAGAAVAAPITAALGGAFTIGLAGAGTLLATGATSRWSRH